MHRDRASQLSRAPERLTGIALEQPPTEQHAQTEGAGEEDDFGWQPLPDLPSSDTSSEFSNMPEILPGDPAEAAAARVDVYVSLPVQLGSIVHNVPHAVLNSGRPVQMSVPSL